MRCRRVGINSLVKKYGPFVSIQIGGTLRGKGKSLLVTHVDLGRTIEASFRGDEHDAVGSAHSINCRGTGVFENTERFDFKGIDVVHRPLDTVNQNQWVAIAGKGTDTPNPELRVVLARLSRTLYGDNAGDSASNGVIE